METNQSSINQNQIGVETQPQQVSISNSRLFVLIIISILLTAIITGLVVYFWQKSTKEKTIDNLKQKIASLEEQPLETKHEKTVTQSASLPATLPTHTPSSEINETADWKTFSSDKGYQVRYPNNLTPKERVPGFFVFLENKTNPNSVLFYIDERGKKTLAERKKWQKDNLTDATYTNISVPGVQGFIVEGKVGLGLGHGLQVKNAYIDLDGKELIIGCDTNETCRSRILDQILSTFKFTN